MNPSNDIIANKVVPRLRRPCLAMISFDFFYTFLKNKEFEGKKIDYETINQ
ncbi:MAG: hypothetical protein KC455_02960 [Carnobacterium sp.]|nr:hypothetical protein [Carnobacterium sp.]